MKKITRLIFFLLLSITSLLYSQRGSGVITYKQKIVIPEENSKSSKNTYFSALNRASNKKNAKASEYITYKLRFNEHAVSFKPEKVISIDDDIEEAMMHVRGDGERYFSTENKVSLWAHDVFGRDIILVDTINSKEWTITKETKIIGKYKAIKATKDRLLDNKKTIKIIAWFSPEIPNNYGPIGYYGLPGLILEIQEKDFIIYATKVRFNKKPLKIDKPSKGDYMYRKEYDAYIDKAVIEYLTH